LIPELAACIPSGTGVKCDETSAVAAAIAAASTLSGSRTLAGMRHLDLLHRHAKGGEEGQKGRYAPELCRVRLSAD